MDNTTTTNSLLQRIKRFPKAVYRRHPVLSTFAILLTLAYLFFFWDRIIITIHSGERGILFSRFHSGTIMDKSYGEGVYILLPWNIMYIYDMRIQEDPQEVKALTKDGLPIDVQISMKYQLVAEELPTIHQTIGPDYKRKIIYPLITSAVRQAISNYRPNELYSTASLELQDFIIVNAVEEMGRIPILIHSFVVRNIELPESVVSAVQSKLVAEQSFLRYNFILLEAEQEAKRRLIEAEGIRKFQETVNYNMTENYLRYEGIKATERLAGSTNSKIVVIGGKDGMPMILNPQDMPPAPPPTPTQSFAPDKPTGRLLPKIGEQVSPKPAGQAPQPLSAKERTSLQAPDPALAGGEVRASGAASPAPSADTSLWENAVDKLNAIDRTLLYPSRVLR